MHEFGLFAAKFMKYPALRNKSFAISKGRLKCGLRPKHFRAASLHFADKAGIFPRREHFFISNGPFA